MQPSQAWGMAFTDFCAVIVIAVVVYELSLANSKRRD